MIINYKKDFIEGHISKSLFTLLLYKDLYGKTLSLKEWADAGLKRSSYYKAIKEYKNYSNIQLEQPDKPCLRCGHDDKKSLIVVDKTDKDNKVVLCRNCLINLTEI